MPWSVASPMSRRLEFGEDAARGLYSMTALCARYAISRRVGYEWLARFEAEGPDGLVDQRRVAHAHPHRIPEDIAARLVACRKAHPTWVCPFGARASCWRTSSGGTRGRRGPRPARWAGC